MKKFFKSLMVLIVFLPVVLLCACKEPTYKLNFMINGSVYHTIESSGNETITLPEEPTKDGYLFDGWYFDADYLNELTADSYKEKELSHDTNVYAKWLLADFRITYHLDGGTNGNNPAGYARNNEEIVLLSATKYGYTFNGWYTESTYENKVETIPANSIGNVELYAKFDLINPELQFTFTNDGVAVSGYTGSAEKVVIPENYKGFTVTTVKEESFVNNESIKSLVIPETITTIEQNAILDCANFDNVYISNVESWYNINFYGDFYTILYYPEDWESTLDEVYVPQEYNIYVNNNLLENLIVPATIETVSSAFSYCKSIKSITISEGVKTIGNNAFGHCSNLETVTISEGVETIGEFAFYSCKNLKVIDIPTTLTKSDNCSFLLCDSLERVNIKNLESWLNIDFVGELASAPGTESFYQQYIHYFAYYDKIGCSNPLSIAKSLYINGEETKNIIIPDSITELKPHLFGYSNIESVTLNKVVTIGSNAFWNCKQLTSVTLSDCLETIGDKAFSGCSNLLSIDLPESLITIGKEALYNTSIYSIDIPKNLTTLGENFSSATHFNVHEENSVYDSRNNCGMLIETAINKIVRGSTYVEEYNEELDIDQLIIPEGIEIIGENAFAGLRFENIVFPNSLKRIEANAFNDCEYLQTVTLGTGLEFIGGDAFIYCSNIEFINIPNLTVWCNIEFENMRANPLSWKDSTHNAQIIDRDARLYVDGAELKDNLIIPEGVETLHSYSFANIINFKTVTIPSSVKYIGTDVFEFCANLTQVNYNATSAEYTQNGPGGTTFVMPTINDIKLEIGANVKKIPAYFINGLFDEINITNVVFEEGSICEEIGESAFGGTSQHKSNLKTINLPNTIKKINKEAFSFCEKLEEINLPDSLEYIGDNAFTYCINLKEINIGKSVSYIGSGVLAACVSLTNIFWDAENPTTRGYMFSSAGFYKPDLTLEIGPNAKIIPSVFSGNGVYISVVKFAEGYQVEEFKGSFDSDVKDVYLPDLTQWLKIKFSSSSSNPLYYAKNLYINNEKVTRLKIEGVTEIKPYTFYTEAITEVVLADTITTVDSNSFNKYYIQKAYFAHTELPRFSRNVTYNEEYVYWDGWLIDPNYTYGCNFWCYDGYGNIVEYDKYGNIIDSDSYYE